MTFKIIHHFVSEEGILREIKWLNVSKDTPKEEMYQWQWSPFGFEPVTLHYKSCVSNIRKFEEGNLSFDHVGATFIFYGRAYRLNRSR
jgi:hypothetical protein